MRRFFKWSLFPVLTIGALLLVLLWPSIARWIDREHGLVPIVFYGQVVDEDGNPLAGVRVTAEARKLVWFSNPMAPQYNITQLSAVTDGNGQFSFHSEGINLSITDTRKEGMEALSAPKFFTYPTNRGSYSQGYPPRPDDPKNPVRFAMRPAQRR